MKKKALSLALVLVMCLGLAIPASAALQEVTLNPNDSLGNDKPGALIIKNVISTSSVTGKAFGSSYTLYDVEAGDVLFQEFCPAADGAVTVYEYFIREGEQAADGSFVSVSDHETPLEISYNIGGTDKFLDFDATKGGEDHFTFTCTEADAGKVYCISLTFEVQINGGMDRRSAAQIEDFFLRINSAQSAAPAQEENYVTIQAGETEGMDASGNVFKLSQPVAGVTTSKAGFPVHQIPEGTVISLYNSDGSLADSIFMEEYVEEESEAAWPGENPFAFQAASENLVSLRTSADAYLFVQVVTNTSGPAVTVEDIPASGTAKASTQTVTVDGEAVEFEMYALADENGNLTNYIKLRDLAYVLNGTAAQFAVGWDGSISLTTGQPYAADGNEMSTPFSGDRAYTGGSQSVKVDGADVAMTAITLTDDAGGGYNYFKLRDLGAVLGFNVSWDNGVIIESDKPYAG